MCIGVLAELGVQPSMSSMGQWSLLIAPARGWQDVNQFSQVEHAWYAHPRVNSSAAVYATATACLDVLVARALLCSVSASLLTIYSELLSKTLALQVLCRPFAPRVIGSNS